MKIKKLLLSLLAILPVSMMMMGSVSAGNNDSNITYQKIDGVYFYLQDKTSGAVDTNYVTKFYLNGKIAYCIEPMKDINDRVFNSTTDWSITNLSQTDIEYIEMVGYFGYEYPGHKTDNYWLAAQKMIWEKVNSNVSVKFTTAANGGGSNIDLSNETKEILNLIEQYKTLPSFADTVIEGNIDSELTITDTNGTLKDYTMSYSGKHQVTKNENTLQIKFSKNEIRTETIKFTRENYDNEPSIIYYKNESQKLASLRITNKSEFTVTLKSNGATFEINKIGEKLVYDNGSFRYDLAKVPNTKFALYANEDITDSKGNIIYKQYQLIDTFTTNEESIATLTDMPLGEYFWVEVESANNHILDNQKYYFEITSDDIVDGKLIKHFNFKNYLPKGTLEFLKVDSATGEPIANTTIQIFNEEDRLIFTGTTDENGRIVITNLPVGEKFYIIEKNPANGYQMTDEVIWFEITENGEIVKVSMDNEKIPTEVVDVPNTSLDSMTGVVLVYSIMFLSFGIAIGYLFRTYLENKGNKNERKNKKQ